MPLLLFFSFNFTFFIIYSHSLFIKPVIAGTTESSAGSPPSILLLFSFSDNQTPEIPNFPHPFSCPLDFDNQYTMETCDCSPQKTTMWYTFVRRHSGTLYTFAGHTHTHRGEFPMLTEVLPVLCTLICRIKGKR